MLGIHDEAAPRSQRMVPVVPVPTKNQVELVELAARSHLPFARHDVLVGYVGILIEPRRVRFRLQYLLYFFQSAFLRIRRRRRVLERLNLRPQ